MGGGGYGGGGGGGSGSSSSRVCGAAGMGMDGWLVGWLDGWMEESWRVGELERASHKKGTSLQMSPFSYLFNY